MSDKRPNGDIARRIEAVLAEHESLLGSDDYTQCVCGAETVNLGGLRKHVAEAIAVALRNRPGVSEDTPMTP